MDYLPNPEGILKPHFTVRDLANSYGCCTRTILRLIQRGEIGVIKIGRHIRIPSDQIKRFAQDQIDVMNNRTKQVREMIGGRHA